MKKTIFILFKIVGFLLVVLIAIALFPEFWFTTPVLKTAISYLNKSTSSEIKFHDIQASAQRKSWKKIEFQLVGKEISIQPKKNEPHVTTDSISAKIEKLKIRVAVNWVQIPPELSVIEELQLESSSLLVQSSKTKEADSTKTSSFQFTDLNPSEFIPQWIQKLKLGNVYLYIARVGTEPKELNWEARISAPLNESQIKISLEDRKKHGFARVTVPLDSERRLNFLQIQAQVQWPTSPFATVKANIFSKKCHQDRTCITAKTKLVSKRRKDPTGFVDLVSEISPKEVKVDVRGSFLKIHPWLPRLTTRKPCILKAQAKSNSRLATDFTCSIHAVLKIPPIVEVPKLQFPTHTKIKVDLNAELDKNVKGIPYRGKLAVYSQPVIKPLLEANIDMKSNFNGNVLQIIRGLHHTTKLLVKARIPKIEKVITFLHDTKWAIPAPLNNLKGEMVLDLVSRWKDWDSYAPFQFSSKLISKEQSLQTEAKGNFTFSTWPQFIGAVDADWVLQDIRLSTPRLNLKDLPRFFPDSQIVTEKEQKKRELASTKKPFPLNYRVKIYTLKGHPILIDSNLLKEPIAFDLKSEIRNQSPTQANVNTHPVNFEVFRRKAVIEKMDFYYAGTPEDSLLDGRVRVHSGEAKIFIKLYGRPDKVRVHLTSEPPVPQDELWALLLFGEPLEGLDSDQQDSAQSAQRALSKGAFGLLSLYLFASTPIQRVDYDSTLQRVSVRFRVQEGTSLEIGHSEEEVGSLGLRKRLGRGWSLNAKVGEGDEEKQGKAQAGATLEWSTRY